MKRFGKAILVLSVAASLAFTSCATTAMTMTKVAEKEDVKRGLKEPRFDFIGFKVDADTLPGSSKNTYYTGSGTKTVESTKVDWYKDFAKGTCLDNFASDLEDANLAYDKTNNYIGDFSSADLKNYKSRNGSRYITWAAVTDCSCTYTQSSNNSKFIRLGSTGLTLGLGGLAMGGIMYL